MARPLRETYSPSYWHFPQPATDWIPLGSRPKWRIMIREYGSWPPSRHSLSAHSIRLSPILLSQYGIMAQSAHAALHMRNVPVAMYKAQCACFSRCNRMPSWKLVEPSPYSPYFGSKFATQSIVLSQKLGSGRFSLIEYVQIREHVIQVFLSGAIGLLLLYPLYLEFQTGSQLFY